MDVMDKKSFYKEQAEKFRDFADKNPNSELLPLFEEWCNSKDIYGRDRHEIWRIARKIRGPMKPFVIKENSEEFVRINAVLDILLQADLKYLNELIEKRKKEKEKEEK